MENESTNDEDNYEKEKFKHKNSRKNGGQGRATASHSQSPSHKRIQEKWRQGHRITAQERPTLELKYKDGRAMGESIRVKGHNDSPM